MERVVNGAEEFEKDKAWVEVEAQLRIHFGESFVVELYTSISFDRVKHIALIFKISSFWYLPMSPEHFFFELYYATNLENCRSFFKFTNTRIWLLSRFFNIATHFAPYNYHFITNELCQRLYTLLLVWFSLKYSQTQITYAWKVPV